MYVLLAGSKQVSTYIFNMKEASVKSNKVIVEKTLVELENIPVVDFICPCCGVVTDYLCRLCGATRTTNQVSGNIIWMRNGRVIAAFTDSLQAWTRMTSIYNISRDKWPEQFRNVTVPKNDPFEE